MSSAVICLVSILQAIAASQAPAARELRFHHFHVRVADPASAMGYAADRLRGTRTMLQGHGPGVRAWGGYLIFDREVDQRSSDELSDSYKAATRAASAYLEARKWLNDRGFWIDPMEFENMVNLQGGLPSGRIDVIAFSAADPGKVVELLRSRAPEPFERTTDTARYRITPELILEIISETDRPDTHWCPMHPGIRGPGAGRCELCNMELVPIPPPRIGEYAMDLDVARTGKPKATRLTFTIRDPLTTKPVSTFLDVHERPFHLFIISRDLSSFSHVHPAQAADGRFTIDHELDPGEYVLIADFLPAGGTPQLIHRAFVTPGYSGALFSRSPVLQAGATEKVVEGLRVRLDASGLMALRPSSLRFTVSDAETQTPVRDLEPYLGATAHLLIVNPDVTVAIHGHPEGVLSAGPDVAFDPILPLAGFYKLWVQLQRQGRVVTVPFVIQVAPR